MSEKLYDIVIIGSGFGGSVMAYRLSKKGYSVLVLERGKRWQADEFPREVDDKWLYDPYKPDKLHGWIDLRVFKDMAVAQGAGVGGGSLIYANILVDAPELIFKTGWPDGINYQELKHYYSQVEDVLCPQELPDNQLTERFKLMRDGAQGLGHAQRFQKLPIAVQFDENYNYDLPDPFDKKHSKEVTNNFGQKQGTCIHLGNCDIGCDVLAKNTLDLNYLAGAEQNGAEIRPLHLVDNISPIENNGYRINFKKIIEGNNSLEKGHVQASKVILAAGSLSSTELLLRCKLQSKSMPRISSKLGYGWCSNGDFLTPAIYKDRRINPSEGPTITCAIDFLDGSQQGQRFYIEDGGFPDLLKGVLDSDKGANIKYRSYRDSLKEYRNVYKDDRSMFDGVMPWFAQGVDSPDGKLYLGRKWFTPWKKELLLDWDIKKSAAVIEAIINMHEKLSNQTNASKVLVPPTWTLFKNLITPHPLGGCNMAQTIEHGVVDQHGKVFGYDGLYVVDGAIVPTPIGRNPSKTIAALAERCAANFTM